MTVEANDRLPVCDIIQLSRVLRICEMEMMLLGNDAPCAFVDSMVLDEAIFCRFEVGFSFRGRFVLPRDWCIVGYIDYAPEGCWCHGMPLESDMAFTVTPESVTEILLAASTRITLALVPFSDLLERRAALKPQHVEVPLHTLSLFRLSSGGPTQELRSVFRQIGESLATSGMGADAQPSDIELSAQLTARLIDAHLIVGLGATADDRPQCSRKRRGYYEIVRRAEEFMRSNMRREIYINEICNAVGVSDRVLRYAFDHVIGISPTRYLSMLRLCTASRNLSSSDGSRRSVKAIALSCGLWDLSRFADHYRRVFGELPRDTLMRAPCSSLG